MQISLMEIGVIVRLLLLCMACCLVGCERPEKQPSTASLAPDALMRVALPGWAPDGEAAVREIASPPEEGEVQGKAGLVVMPYILSPKLVVPLSAQRVVLIVEGTPSDEKGVPQVGHASTALLGAYWFEKRGERWYLVVEQAEFAQEGFSGMAGDLRAVDLGEGRQGLAVENGSCWQGACGSWLSLYWIGEQKVEPVFDDMLSSDTEGASEHCSDWLKLEDGRPLRLTGDSLGSALGCYDIDGRWQLHTGTAPVELRIEFSGAMVDEENEDGEAAGRLTKRRISQRQTFRFANGRFVLQSGENPNPGL